MKKYILVFALFLIASCQTALQEKDFRCPNVTIPGDKAYMTQIVDYVDNFRIELVGYEGYCAMEEGLNRRYAVITPRFVVTRLRDGDETALDFNFYTEIVQGPPAFVGKKSYSASGQIAAGEEEVTFTGRPVKVKIPVDDDMIEVMLGLDVSDAEHRYNQRTFDTRSRSRKPIETPCGTIIPSVDPAEEPAPASSGCNSCSL